MRAAFDLQDLLPILSCLVLNSGELATSLFCDLFKRSTTFAFYWNAAILNFESTQNNSNTSLAVSLSYSFSLCWLPDVAITTLLAYYYLQFNSKTRITRIILQNFAFAFISAVGS